MAPLKKPRLPQSRKGRPGPRRPVSPRPVQSTWYLLALFLVLALVQTYLFMPAGRTIPYSEFKNLVAQDKVAELTVSDQTIRGQLKNDAADAKTRAFVTTRIEDPKLVDDLDAHKVKYTGEVGSHWMSDLLSWVLPLVFIIGISSFFFRRMSSAEGGVMSFARSRGKIYAEDDVKVTFADVAGVDEAEDELKEIVEFLRTPRRVHAAWRTNPQGRAARRPSRHRQDAARAGGGRRSARAVLQPQRVGVRRNVRRRRRGAGARPVPAGRGQGAVHRVHRRAGRARQGPRPEPAGSHEEREQTLNQLLAEMDGFDARKGVIIMAATNRPEVLDAALLRPGRFDRQVLVDKPDVKGREAILAIHAKGVKVDPALDLKVIAARTAGFAGADLANLVNEAALLAARRNKPHVEMAEFDEAIDRTIAGLEKKRVMNDREREIIAYHESGHAIVATVIPGLDPVHKISIVQRGFGALGYTMQLPLEDRYLMTRTALHDQIAVLLAGRTAEELAIGDISTGAQNDLQRASDLARAMVTEYGMSDTIGAVTFDDHARNRFLDVGLGSERGAYAEETAKEIDTEIRRIVDTAHQRARDLLAAHRQTLDVVARRLLEKEVIEGEELRGLIGQAAQGLEPGK